MVTMVDAFKVLNFPTKNTISRKPHFYSLKTKPCKSREIITMKNAYRLSPMDGTLDRHINQDVKGLLVYTIEYWHLSRI